MSSPISTIEIPECSPKCRSVIHGSRVVSALTRSLGIELLAYIRCVCTNYARVVDGLGRNALHMAASCGRRGIVKWLLKHDHCEPDVKDLESGWTALHRSLYYGQLAVAKFLIQHGASLQAVDNGGFTPLDIVVRDRLPYVEYSLNVPCEVYVWGCNTNFNLGLENPQSRSSPEILEVFKREKLSIKQVLMCKYHTVFLSHDGRVFSCGHGQGGRLGHDSEQTILAPKQIKTLFAEDCIQVAGGTDHTVFLTKSGSVWTCGVNSYNQLGHVPPPERLMTPKLIKGLKGTFITGVAASRFHTVVYNKDALYTFGLNAGQLGHLKRERYETNPRHVSAINTREAKIVGVATSDGATVCFTERGDVFVLNKYQCRKIASKQLDIASITAVGGSLDVKCNPDTLKENGGLELEIVMLTKTGKVFIWRESSTQFLRCVFPASNQLHVTNLSLNRTSLILITNDGEGFIGTLKNRQKSNETMASGDRANMLPKKQKKISKEDIDSGTGDHKNKDITVKSSQSSKSFMEFLEKDNCETIVIKRLPSVHRAVASASDPKGKNFAIIQSHPSIGTFEYPEIDSPNMNKHLASLLEMSDIYDNIHDVVIQVGEEQFAAHSYILASRSEYFSKLFLERFAKNCNSMDKPIVIENIHPEIFRQILKYIYSGHCDFFIVNNKLSQALTISQNQGKENKQKEQIEGMGKKSAYEIAKNQKKSAKENSVDKNIELSVVKRMQDAARKIGLHALIKQMDFVKIRDNIIVDVPSYEKIRKPIRFDRRKHPHLYDTNIVCEEGIKLQCHKSVLVARLEYFQGMFSSGWIETSSTLHLPIPVNVLEVVIDYLYTDESPILSKCEDADFLCRILVVADQLLIERLKQMCEKALTELITLKNASEFLEFSYLYNAKQLQETCMEFIGVNLAAILDNKGLSILSDEVLDLLSKTYRNMVPGMKYRFVTPYHDAPTEDEILIVAKQHPVVEEMEEEEENRQPVNLQLLAKKPKIKRKSRSHKNSGGQVSHKQVLKILESELEIEENNEKDNLIQPESPPKLITTSEPISIPITNQREVSFSYESSASPELTPNISSADSISTPWSKSRFFNESLDLKSIMEQQKELEDKRKSLKAKTGSSSEFKKTTKLSQKQKKKLSGSFTGSEGEIVGSSSFEESKIEVNVWGKRGLAAAENLSDIMKSEAKIENRRKVSTSTENKPTDVASPPFVGNPWSKSQREETSFAEILHDEQTKSANLKKVQSKPLHLIQFEEEAIEELMKYYQAIDNPEEIITIQRILPESVAVPVWKVSTSDDNGAVKKYAHK